MLKFLKYVLNNYDNYKEPKMTYDEDGNYVDAKLLKLSADELMLPAEKARILLSKSAEDVKLRERKKIFHLIHNHIKQGKTSVRLETYSAKPHVMEYLATLGYTIETITPPATGNNPFVPTMFDDDGEEMESDGVYRYYKVSWAPDPVVAAAEQTLITAITAGVN